jgi:hypothetical protein
MIEQEIPIAQRVYDKLSSQAPNGYRLNELKQFSYPVRRIRIELLLNKNPDKSLEKVYNVLLRAIMAGLDTKEALFYFLGFSPNDEFMERELYFLREREFLDLVSNRWVITALGKQFLDGQPVMRSEEKEVFEFILDGLSGEPISKASFKLESKPSGKVVQSTLPKEQRNPRLLDGKFDALAELVKNEYQDKAYLISYDPNAIMKDYPEWIPCWFIEYIPDKDKTQEARLEIKSFDGLKKVDFLTRLFNEDYRHWLLEITGNEREVMEEVLQLAGQQEAEPPRQTGTQPLSVWKTKEKFVEALQTVNKRILIESPWIKQATMEYIPLFEKILQEKKQLVILYGIGDNDEYHGQSLRKLEEMQRRYPDSFHLIHLPTHLTGVRSRLTGTHRKLVIKDEDYYISGSFNFLSFGKQEHQRVANEESTVFFEGVAARWEAVVKEYELPFL